MNQTNLFGSRFARLNRIVPAIVVVLLVLVYFEYRKDIDQARGRVDAGSHIVQTDCGSIEYATAGSGPPVLVVHTRT